MTHMCATQSGGHRLNCLCYLLDSRDKNGFVPSYGVTKAGVPYKRPSLKKFYFHLPELQAWIQGRGDAYNVVVAFPREPATVGDLPTIDHVPTRIFFPEDDGTSRMETFVAEIDRDDDDERNGRWLNEWKPLLLLVEKRIAGITLPITTINCARKYAIESYLFINTNGQALTQQDVDKAKEAALKDKTKVFDELLDHEYWKDKKETSGPRIFQSRPFQRTLFELSAVLLFECGLESSGEWWEWGVKCML